MEIILTPDQEAWLRERVACGEFASANEAIGRLIDLWTLGAQTDLDWAKPLVDEALEAVERGDEITLEEHKARMAERLARLAG